MKHFIIIIYYLESNEKIKEIRPRHKQFIENAYRENVVLFSGPQSAGRGGIIVAKGKSPEELKNYFKNDPYVKENAAEYKFIEFEPVHYQKLLEDWVRK